MPGTASAVVGMTDARLPERWLSDARLQRVSPEAFRAFANSLMWAVSNRTDGHVPVWALALIPHIDEQCARELTAAGLWAGHARDGWVVLSFEETQTTAADLAGLADGRRKQRDRQRRHRAHSAGNHSLCGDRPCNPAVTRDATRDVPRLSPRTGQARPGNTRTGSTTSTLATNRSTDRSEAPATENDVTDMCEACGVRRVSLALKAMTRKSFGRVLCSACAPLAAVDGGDRGA
jgi:hypothetical protein